MKRILTLVTMLALVAGFTSCKPKQSAYRAAYERAQQKPIAQQEEEQVRPVSDYSTEESVRQERVTPAEGESATGLKSFSVVIGSFQNLTNARSLKERMIGEGFTQAMLAQNEQGMYRVIVTSFDNKSEAVLSRDSIKSRFAPLFQDAWILQQAY